MVSASTEWITISIVVITVLSVVLNRLAPVPHFVSLRGPLITVKTSRGKELLDKVANSNKRIIGAWGDAGLLLTVLLMVGSLFLLLQSVVAVSNGREQAISNPKNLLVIPGVNDFLPLAALPAIAVGLVVGMIVHEGGHGIYSRVADISIDSMGATFVAVVPLGAFVDPDQEEVEQSSTRARGRMLAAGIMNNVALSMVLLLLLFGLAGSFAPATGVGVGGVYPNSAASDAGIKSGSLIVGVNGTQVESQSEWRTELSSIESRSVNVTFSNGESVTLNRSLTVTAVTVHQNVTFNPGDTITKVNDEKVFTKTGLSEAVEGEETVTVTTSDGDVRTIRTGAYVSGLTDNSPLYETGVKAPFTVTKFDGERIETTSELVDEVDAASPNQAVSLTVVKDGEVKNVTVSLGGTGNTAVLGVSVEGEVNGVQLTETGIDPYPAKQLLGLIQSPENGANLLQYLLILLLLPLLEAVQPSAEYSFPGFVGDVSTYYQVVGPLSVVGNTAFTVFNIAFWTFWINIQLGFFNSFPIYPLDGGRITKAGFEWVEDKIPVDLPAPATRYATICVWGITLVALGITIFG